MSMDGFDPEDLNELSEAFAEIERESDVLVVQFELTRHSAHELVGYWARAIMGDPTGISICIGEMGKIVSHLKDMLNEN